MKNCMSDLMTQMMIIIIKVNKSNNNKTNKISSTYQSEVKAPSNKPAVYSSVSSFDLPDI